MSYRVFSSYPSLLQIPLNIIISLKIELYSREEMNQFYIIEIKINFSFYELIWRQTRDLRTEEKKMKNTFLPDTAMITVSVTKNMKGNVIEERKNKCWLQAHCGQSNYLQYVPCWLEINTL